MIPELETLIAQLKRDLQWRGPSGRPLAHIVIDRATAQNLLNYLTKESK